MGQPLTRSQQNYRVVLLGITFMIMFTAFNSLQNSVSTIYEEYGFHNLGKYSLLFLYGVFGVSTFFTPFLIRKFGYKVVMFVSCLGYALYQVAGLIIVLWQGIPLALGWIFVMFGAAACGASASAIWVAQGSYVSVVAGDERKTELFGMFWMLMMSSQILGNVLIAFVQGPIGKIAYFIVLTCLGVGSAFLFFLLPDVQANEQGGEFSIKSEAKKVFALMKDTKYIYLTIYYFFPGLTIGFYATFVSTLVSSSLPFTTGQDLIVSTGYVFIALGVSQSITGLVMNRFFQPFCKFKLALIGTVVVELAGFVSLLCYFLQAYGLCFFVSILWGISQTYLQTNTGALIGKVYPGKVESFSVFRVVFAFGTVVTLLLNIALEDAPGWVFLTVIMVIQLLTTVLATQIIDLKPKQKKSLVTTQEQDESNKLKE